MSNNTTTAVEFVDQASCESIDKYLSISIGGLSLLVVIFLVRIVDPIAKTDTKWFASLLMIPFFVLVANHVYLNYGQTYVDKYSSILPSQIPLFLPSALGILVWLLTNFHKWVLLIAVVATIVYYLMAQMAIAYTITTMIIAIVIVVFILRIPSVEARGMQILVAMAEGTTWIVLALGLWTPDDEACGHPRNKLALCTPACGTITTNFILSTMWIGIAAGSLVAAVILTIIYDCCRGGSKSDKEKAEKKRKEEEKKLEMVPLQSGTGGHLQSSNEKRR